jgi:predicted dehydrogenase
VASVFAFSARLEHEIDVDDTTACLFRFAGGATGMLGTLHATSRFYRIHAFGSNGALEMRGDAALNVFDLDGEVRSLSFAAVDKERAELEAFADAVVKFAIAPETIVNVVAVTEAVAASARSGKAVTIA